MTQIFVSYAHADTLLLDAFLKALAPVARRHGATIWHDRKMTAGQTLDPVIAAAMAASDVFVAFVSQSSLTSDYIMEIELPAMRGAAGARGATLLPIIVEPCSWKDEFGQILAAPLTHRGILKPITEWTPRSKGYHEAAEQVGRALTDLAAPPASGDLGPPPPIPDDEPGPKFGLVDGKFDLIAEPIPQEERIAQAQISLHARLRERIGRLGDDMQRVENSHRSLCREFDDYRRFVASDLAALDVAALLSAGNGLAAMVAMLDGHDPAATGTMTEALEPEIVGGLKALLADHAVFVMGFEEGRDLTARQAQYRLYGEDLHNVRDRTEAVLAEFVRRPTLFGEKAKSLITSSWRALNDGAWEARDLVETGAGLAVNGVVAIGRELAPKLMEAATPVAAVGGATWFLSTLAGDPNMEAIRAGLALFTEAARPLAAIAVGQDIQRFVSWIGEAARKVIRGAGDNIVAPDQPGANAPDEPPAGFDMDLVHEMILRGEAPPKAWVKFVTELNFLPIGALSDLSLFYELIHLRSLYIYGKSIENLSPLAKLAGLNTLCIVSTSVTDLSPLAELTALEYLDISGSPVSDLSPLAGLTALTSLNMSGTPVSDLSPLAGLAALEGIDISHTAITDLSQIINLRALKSIDCAATLVSDLSLVANLASLERIDISHTPIMDLSPLSGLAILESINISNTPVTDLSPLSGLTILGSIDISNTPVTDLSPLSGLTILESIDISNTPVTDLSPLAELVTLESIDIADTPITDLSPLGNLTNLANIYMQRTKILDITPLARLIFLTNLDISRTLVTDLSPLAGSSRLFNLDIEGTAVTDLVVIETLPSLVNLKASNLRGVIRWPNSWPLSLEQLDLFNSNWPAGHLLPEVPWRIAPDGKIKRADGKTPMLFRWWLTEVEQQLNLPPSSPEG